VREVSAKTLRSKGSNSCGCIRNELARLQGPKRAKYRVEIGERFNRLTVLEVESHLRIKCLCSCGNETWVTSYMLRKNRTRSCGCLRREMIRDVAKAQAKHNFSTNTLYSTWRRLVPACTKPGSASWHLYGAKGIAMHPAWINDVAQFILDAEAEIGPRPSSSMALDRIDTSAGFVPGNLRWAPRGVGRRASKFTVEQDEQAVRMVIEQGMTQRAVAAHFGMGIDHVHKVVKKARQK